MDEQTVITCLAGISPPASLANDPYHIANDSYQQSLESLEREILVFCATLEPEVVQIARLKFKGESNRAICRALKRRKADVLVWLESIPCQRLINYLQHRQLLEAGADECHIKHKLWCIAVDNEKDDPAAAIKALQELNRMRAPKHTGGGGQQLQIVINNAVLPRGALDG